MAKVKSNAIKNSEFCKCDSVEVSSTLKKITLGKGCVCFNGKGDIKARRNAVSVEEW